MFTPKILIKRVFDIGDITIEHTAASNRNITPTIHTQVDQLRNDIILQDQKKGRKRRDGTYYRVENLSELNDQANPIFLKLNTINYRYLCTMNHFMEYYKENPSRYPNHLSTAAMIETSDGFFVFGRRKGTENVDLIGGGAQPDELPISKGSDLEANLRKEMLEEAGIENTNIVSLQGIGFVFSYKSNILLIGHVLLNLNREEIDNVFRNRHDDEMDALVYVHKDDIDTYMKHMESYRYLVPDLLPTDQ